MIKVGMNLLLWSDDANFAQHKGLLDFCKEVGFDGVEFNVGIVSDPGECQLFGAYAKELGLDVTTGTSTSVANPVSPDPVLRAAVSGIWEFVDNTLRLGGTLICGPVPGLGYFRAHGTEWACPRRP